MAQQLLTTSPLLCILGLFLFLNPAQASGAAGLGGAGALEGVSLLQTKTQVVTRASFGSSTEEKTTQLSEPTEASLLEEDSAGASLLQTKTEVTRAKVSTTEETTLSEPPQAELLEDSGDSVKPKTTEELKTTSSSRRRRRSSGTSGTPAALGGGLGSGSVSLVQQAATPVAMESHGAEAVGFSRLQTKTTVMKKVLPPPEDEEEEDDLLQE